MHSLEKDASLQMREGNRCRCICVNTRVNAETPARRGGEKEVGMSDRVLAGLQCWIHLPTL